MTTDWAAYFAAHRAAAAEAVVPEPYSVVLRRSEPDEAARKRLGSGVRKAIARLEDWPVFHLRWSLVWHSSEFYAADSMLKPGQETPDHRKGEKKKDAALVRHWWLQAAQPAYRLAVRLHWEEGVTPKGGRSFGFQEGLCADSVGMPRPLELDYSVTADDKKRRKDEPGEMYESRVQLAEYAARRRDREYNDPPASYLDHRPLFTSWKEFDVWLGEWEQVLKEKEGTE